LPPEDAARFAEMRVHEIIARPPQDQVNEPHCKNISSEAKRLIGAGSLVIARKRTATLGETAPAAAEPTTNDAVQVQLRALQAEIAALHDSTSWKLTEPLRALRRLWRASR